jgi:hypothetical protein
MTWLLLTVAGLALLLAWALNDFTRDRSED